MNGNTAGDEDGEYTFINSRNDSSVIDYGIVNNEARYKIKRFEIEERIESDHQPIAITLTSHSNSARDRHEGKSVVVWNEKSIRAYKEKIIKVSQIECKDDINEEMEELITVVNESMTRVTKKVQNTLYDKNDWWDKECRDKKKEVRRALRKFKKGHISIEEYNKTNKEYKNLRKEKLATQIEKVKTELYNITSEAEAWKYIKKERKKCKEVDENISPAEWKQHFISLLNGEDKSPNKTFRPTSSSQIYEYSEITEDEVARQVNKLKKNKASGADGITNETLIYGDALLLKIVTSIINKVWNGAGFPKQWRRGIIRPIHKKGDTQITTNYRGITLLNTTYKLYAMILEQRLRDELEKNEILPDTQAGFRKGRSTLGNIYILNYIIEQVLAKERGKIYAFFIDLKSAFDKVDRDRLLEIMEKQNINQHLTKRIEEIYLETSNTVRTERNNSEEFCTITGLRQGCPLSPSLFAIYLSDIEEYFSRGQTGGVVIGTKKIWSLAYADDLVLLAKTEEEMKSVIKRLEKYLRRKKMSLNIEKSKIMKFKKGGGRERNTDWMWQGHIIERVKEFKYLGYTFSQNNTENKHVEYQAKKANIAMREIWGIAERKFTNNYKIRLMLFDSIVKSILIYGAEIWGWSEISKIEIIQNKYLTWTLGLENHTPQYIINEETNRDKLRISAGLRAVKFEEKIRTCNPDRVLYQCWEIMNKKQDRKLKENNWEIKRRKYYERNGYSATEVERYRNNNIDIKQELKIRDQELQKQDQDKKIRESRYNRIYKNIRPLTIPSYLTNKNKLAIKAIARLRCGNEENNNKYWKSDEERKCRLCNEGKETIQHLMYNCRELTREESSIYHILDESGSGGPWIKRVQEKREELNQ